VPNFFDVVPPELDADGVLLTRWEDVHDASAHCDLSTSLDEIDALVPESDEAFDARRQIDAVTSSHANWSGLDHRGRDRLNDGPNGRHDYVDGQQQRIPRIRVGDSAQQVGSPPDRVEGRGQSFVREGLPRRERRDPYVGREVSDGRGHVVGTRSGGGEHQDRVGRRSLDAADRDRVHAEVAVYVNVLSRCVGCEFIDPHKRWMSIEIGY
jgi:hypothetical protein